MAEPRTHQPLSPPLKWAGGKRWLLQYLRPVWKDHAHRRLVEPLGGGLAITLGLRPQRAWINDINPHLINFYRWVKQGLDLPFSEKDHNPEAYYRYRARFNQLIANGGATSKEAAQLFYYLNRTCYNGLCRFNASGEFNVPFGKYKRIQYARGFPHHEEAFKEWEFTCGDFEKMTGLEPEDFIYADPPYDVEFTKYAKDGFSWEDQERLAQWLAKHQGPVVISNQATARVKDLYALHGYLMYEVPGPRRISCNGDRRPALEVLAFRNVELPNSLREMLEVAGARTQANNEA
ncbi:MAG TPA: adenine methyltransferase [Clostridiales bacterium]|nr:adenine methyltransferase [Clostridiales bacterium]